GLSGADSVERTLDPAEQWAGRRVRAKAFRPIPDAATCFGAIPARETAQAAPRYSAEQRVDARGLCPANVSTRLARGRIRIPAATAWTYAAGVEPEFAPEGRR